MESSRRLSIIEQHSPQSLWQVIGIIFFYFFIIKPLKGTYFLPWGIVHIITTAQVLLRFYSPLPNPNRSSALVEYRRMLVEGLMSSLKDSLRKSDKIESGKVGTSTEIPFTPLRSVRR